MAEEINKIPQNISFMRYFSEIYFSKFYLNQSLFFTRNRKVEKSMIQEKVNKFSSVSFQRFLTWQNIKNIYVLLVKRKVFVITRYAIWSITTIIYYSKMIDINEITYAG